MRLVFRNDPIAKFVRSIPTTVRRRSIPNNRRVIYFTSSANGYSISDFSISRRYRFSTYVRAHDQYQCRCPKYRQQYRSFEGRLMTTGFRAPTNGDKRIRNWKWATVRVGGGVAEKTVNRVRKTCHRRKRDFRRIANSNTITKRIVEKKTPSGLQTNG